jgi:hypothetical protein
MPENQRGQVEASEAREIGICGRHNLGYGAERPNVSNAATGLLGPKKVAITTSSIKRLHQHTASQSIGSVVGLTYHMWCVIPVHTCGAIRSVR